MFDICMHFYFNVFLLQTEQVLITFKFQNKL